MPIKWKLFRVVCIIQMLGVSVLAIMSLIQFIKEGNFYAVASVLLFLLIFLLTILALNILNNNYPGVPVSGTQKTNFNRLFLLNFFFLVFLFGNIFGEYRELNLIAEFTGKSLFTLPFQLFIYLAANLVTLILQFIVLYGLYVLRRELYTNFMKKQFDFEKDQLP